MLKFFKSLFGKDNQELVRAFENGAVIVDVRTAAEFSQGHIPGSKNIPLNELKLKSDLIRKWNKPVITVCRSGNRSGIAKGILKATGIDAYNGGAWTNLKTSQ
ncbi:Rhodanese-related sulfurtransferase [Hydrobacter penzbergensis]|uniref:Rhodanese-related sulfurtransferase n=1 Tax=Hydrobacter penzbergensis TaxID=1235997 RepID=A0A8X8LCC6_9BACT|nr:rhodanese-like domain-containing protein [Hydrobacter penzbergensis]SDW15756.1 Rhodanese-related sulfurtransferase [Hydrobacter penzbergensis]